MEVLLVVIGIVVGLAIGGIYVRCNSLGTICVDQSDPTEAPYLFLELKDSMAVASIIKKKHVVFQVQLKNYVSQD